MMKKLMLNHIRLRNKMLIVYIFCVFLPILLTNVIFYQVTSENVKKQKLEDTSRALEQMKVELWTEIDDAVSVSSGFFTDNTLNELLETNYLYPADYIESYDSYLLRILNSFTPIYNSVQNIKIYLNNPTILHSGGIGFLSDAVKEMDWYKKLDDQSANQPILVRSPREDLIDSNQSKYTRAAFSIVRRMDYYGSLNQWEKILKIEIKPASIQAALSNLNVKGNVYLLNKEGLIEYSTDPEVDWYNGQVEYGALELASDSMELTTSYPEGNHLAGWTIAAVVPEEEMFKELWKSREFIVWLAAINLIVPTLIIIWISRSITARLGSILKHMKRVKNQHFDTIEQAESQDEIGQLTGEFNRMTLQIRSLIKDVYVADILQKNLELERRKAQLNALQSQINPHFLFNALETIRMRSVIKKEKETARIIHNMAKLFRSSLTWKRDKVTVKEEAEFILCFLEIQKYRFAERLHYELHIAPEASDCLIPKLVFLPFVENACIHGIEQLKQGGHIELHIGIVDDYVRFSITDNGKGMQPHQVEHILRYLDEEAEIGERIGVQNVIYRLKMIYGSRFSFNLESQIGEGTSVIIQIPVETAEPPLKISEVNA